MDEEEISYRLLRKIQKREQNSPKLSELRYSFYKNVSEYIQSLEKRLDDEKNQQKQRILEEEIENSKKIFLNIYEQREKKILLAAISKARGGKPSLENTADIEKELFDKILETVNSSRNNVLVKKNENIAVEKDDEPKEIEKKENEESEGKKIDNNNPVIRINNDVPEFIGTDKKKYKLRKDDILSASPDLCKILCKRNISKEIEM